MNGDLSPDAAFFWTSLWQTSACLALALAASFLFRRRAARAHCALLLGMVVAVLTLPLGVAAVRLGWGLFERPTTVTAVTDKPAKRSSNEGPPARETASLHEEPVSMREPPAAANPIQDRPESPTIEARDVVNVAVQSASGVGPDAARTSDTPRQSAFPWPLLLGGLWGVATLALLIRLLLGAVGGARLAAEARLANDPMLLRAAAVAAERMGLRVPPTVRISSRVRCPVVWCWGRGLVVLLPADSLAERSQASLAEILCHELAHWVRRDHWSHLCAEIAVCILPWQPVAWIARVRLRRLSERACDDWALSTGASPVRYADALVALAPQRGATLALAAVSSRRALVERVRHILSGAPRTPQLGRRWRHIAAVTAGAALVVAVLAQTREVRDTPKTDDVPAATSATPAAVTPATVPPPNSRPAISGRIVDSRQQPVAGATVWIVTVRHPEPPTAIASMTTTETGEFTFGEEARAATFDRLFPRAFVFAQDAQNRVGWTPQFLERNSSSLPIVLKDKRDFVGRIQDSTGRAIARARVVVETLNSDDFGQWRDTAATFAPLKERLTAESAADGSFTFRDVPASGSVSARITAVACGEIQASWNWGAPVVIELARSGTVRGRVVVDESGVPEAGLKVWFSGGSQSADRKVADGAAYRTWTMIPNIEVQPDGTFQADNVPPGEHGVSAVIPDDSPLFAPEQRYVKFSVREGETIENVIVLLKRGVAVRGRVVGPTGAGVEGVELMVGFIDKTDTITDRRAATTGPDGKFVGYARPGRALIAVKKLPDDLVPESPSKQHMKLDALYDIEWPTITLRRAGRVEGLVIDDNGNPVSAAEIRCDARDDQFLESRQTARTPFPCDEVGKFAVGQLDPDENAVFRARTSDAVTDGGKAIIPGENKERVTLTVSPKHVFRLRGNVVDASGKAIEGANVTIWWNRKWPSRERFGISGFGSPIEYVRCGANGDFASAALWSGDDYTVKVEAAGYATAETKKVTGAAGETYDFASIVLERIDGAIAGRVLDSDGRPVAGVRVFNAGDARGTPTAQTGLDGAFRLRELPSGTIFLFADKEGHRFTALPAESGQDATITLLRKDQTPAAPPGGVRTASTEERHKLALRLLERIWQREELRASDSMGSLLGYLARIEPARAAEWSDQLGGKWDGAVRMVRFRRLVRQNVEQALPLLGETTDSRTMGQMIDIARDMSRTDPASARLLVDEAVVRARTMDEPARSGAFAELGTLLISLGREEAGRRLISDAIRTANGLPIAGMDAYYRGVAAVALAPLDSAEALKLIQPIAEPNETRRWMSNLAVALASRDPARAEDILTRMVSENFQRDQCRLRIAYQVAGRDPEAAIALANNIGQAYYQAQAFGQIALVADAKDRTLAHASIDRAVEVVAKKADQMRGFSGMGGASVVAATVAYQGVRVQHPDVGQAVARALSLRLGPDMVGSAAESYESQLKTLAILALSDPTTARIGLAALEARLRNLSPDQHGLRANARMAAWALADPAHACELAEAALNAYTPGEEHGFGRTGISTTINVLTAAREDLYAAMSPLFMNAGIWFPGRE